jgi:predicted MPP superfamily phosphohydrolase
MKIFLLGFFIIYVGYRVYTDTYTVRTVSHDLKFKNLPSSLKNLTLLLIADVQIDRYTQESKILEFKDQLKANPADIVFFAGDIITSGTHYIPQGLRVMCDTQSKLGRIACVGDHDFWSDASRIAKGLTDCGWTFLNNTHHIIQHDSAQILITGVTHVYSKRTSNRELEKLLNNAPQADLKILLVHQPAEIVLDAAEKYGYHLLLAGHTHGGQVVFKPFGFTITPTQFENNIYSGFGVWKTLKVFVSNGIGISLMPLRYRAASEILRININ